MLTNFPNRHRLQLPRMYGRTYFSFEHKYILSRNNSKKERERETEGETAIVKLFFFKSNINIHAFSFQAFVYTHPRIYVCIIYFKVAIHLLHFNLTGELQEVKQHEGETYHRNPASDIDVRCYEITSNVQGRSIKIFIMWMLHLIIELDMLAKIFTLLKLNKLFCLYKNEKKNFNSFALRKIRPISHYKLIFTRGSPLVFIVLLLRQLHLWHDVHVELPFSIKLA